MHRAVSMRLGPLPSTQRLLLRRLSSHARCGGGAAGRALLHPRPAALDHPLSAAYVVAQARDRRTRGICSTAPAYKGRRGGASALMPKRPGPPRRKVPGAGKKKKPKMHGAPMSRIYRKKQLEKDAEARMAAISSIPAEDRNSIREMAEAFVNTPLGAESDSLDDFLRQRKDPDAMMLNLGMPLTDGGFAIGDGGVDDGLLLPPSGDGSSIPSGQALSRVPSPESYPSPLSSPVADNLSGPPSAATAVAGAVTGGVGELANAIRGAASAAREDFNLLIRTLGAHDRFEEARDRVLPEMRHRGLKITSETFQALLAGAAVKRDSCAADEVWREMLQAEVKPSEECWGALISAHARSGGVRGAMKLGKEMLEQGHPWGVEIYTTLIAAKTRGRDYSGAWRLWKEMIMWGIKPDAAVYNKMIMLCAKTGQYERAMNFLDEMDMEDIPPSAATIRGLLRAAATAPQWIRAYGTIVDDIVQRFIGLGLPPDEDTYRAMLLAYSKGGDADKVLQCIEEMHELGYGSAEGIGDGTPKLSWQGYCDALDAIARCTSVCRHRGTQPRWGILPGQDALVMDITPLKVPEEDFEGLREMQTTAMEWDEAGEAALKRGFRKGKRKKFMGVTTPKELIGDEDHEIDIEQEYERVLRKAKAMKDLEERESRIRLGMDPDPDAGPQEAKTRPRILPDPRYRDVIQAPVPDWLGEDLDESPPRLPLPPEGTSEPPPLPQGLGIGDGDGIAGLGADAGDRSWEGEAFGGEGRGFGGGGGGGGGGGALDMRLRGGREGDDDNFARFSKDEGVDSRGWEFEGRAERREDEDGREGLHHRHEEPWSMKNQARARQDSPRDRRTVADKPSSPRGEEETLGGAFKKMTMLDLLEADRAREEDEAAALSSSSSSSSYGGDGGDGEDQGAGNGRLVLPDNLEKMMEEVRLLAQQDLDRKKQRHPHLKEKAEENNGEEGYREEEEEEEEEGEDWEGEEDWQNEFWRGKEGALDTRGAEAGAQKGSVEPKVEAESELQRVMTESMLLPSSHSPERSEGGGIERLGGAGGGSRIAPVTGHELEKIRIQDEEATEGGEISSELVAVDKNDGEVEGEEEYEEEYEDWSPLMHLGVKERTRALMGVVKLLEVDAMEAARSADARKGLGVGGSGEVVEAGPAVKAILRARLNTLTESRQAYKAVKFVEEEYPKEGAEVDVNAARQVVEMHINKRSVELAEAFLAECRDKHGLKPDRTVLAPILNARARRGVAWAHEIPHVKRVLDTMQELKIKPHENELRFVRQLVDRGKFDHSWLPVDPNANLKKLRLDMKKSKPVNKPFFKVLSKVNNAKFMQGTGRGKSKIE